MASISKRKWIVLIVIVLSLASLLLHLLIVKYSTIDVAQCNSMAGTEDNFASVSGRQSIRNEKPLAVIKPPHSFQPYA